MSTPAVAGTDRVTASRNRRGRQCSSRPASKKMKLYVFRSSACAIPAAIPPPFEANSCTRYATPMITMRIVSRGLYSSHSPGRCRAVVGLRDAPHHLADQEPAEHEAEPPRQERRDGRKQGDPRDRGPWCLRDRGKPLHETIDRR